ncbi:lipid A deacylase LpxR family protein [Cocleimonas sp. KMM 6892]|uniref:lipid A deacylase LpxR family protein n=1 Tax=unclassified Cocleimonas TaxID=2639732 RepID=UPI002DBDCC7C|nr:MULTISPECIES: lipid A deacylase LpxR family protein [unclassified Cocleimonas]MEB8434358.1 lipid A deacylase LpxR family protein [Cocleimonas sp. KMM 6892]MEC4717239.1 lipid A deacylase LpxR family protein [Cocleimonas sp. KMM 6895]MEC4746618.1 lipid A deacylase LpxR family protein [Cocleimonas sp. KMM 6896]
MKNRISPKIAALVICLIPVSQSQADTNNNDTNTNKTKEPVYWSVQLENDLLSGGDDRFYTSGLQVNRTKRHSPPQWLDNISHKLPFFIDSENKGGGYSFGQKIFTPEDISVSEVIEDDRPYAGWLYGSASLGAVYEDKANYRAMNAYEFTVGIVGPSSQAGNLQEEIHRITGSETAEGWDNQLHDELGLMATYVRKSEHFRSLNNGLEYSWSPHQVLSLGNVYTYAGGGVMFRFGDNLKTDFGPPNIKPGFPGSAFFSPTKNRNWYFFGGVEGRAVAQNIFLDGNTFKDSHSVDKENLVLDAQLGFSYQHDNMRFSYSHVLRSKEFESQDKYANFGSLNVSYYFD